MKKTAGFIGFVVAALMYLFASCLPALAQTEEERNYLLMYFKEEDLVVQSATRSPKPVSQTAENITVVTAADIELMNAHTLADVLNTVTGVEIWTLGGPGQIAQASILGSSSSHVTVMMDGVVLNDINTNLANPGQFPVQNIEKIEIIKGPASSAWGSALGGVVNVITKSGRAADQGATLSGSSGTGGFGDFRAEVRGKQDGFGYYLAAGRLQSGSLTPRMALWNDNAYANLDYDVTDRTSVRLTLDYTRFKEDGGSVSLYDEAYRYIGEYMHTTLGVASTLTRNLSLSLTMRASKQNFTPVVDSLSTGATTYSAKDIDRGYGGSVRLTWKDARQAIVLGVDDDRRTNEDPLIANGKQDVDRWGVYANDTVVLDRFSFTPGIRFDHTNLNGNIVSPSLGITYGLSSDTVLRAYAARGFNNPTPGDTVGNGGSILPNPDLKMETVESYQGGLESAVLKYLWAKLTFFRDEIRNGFDYSTSQTLNIGRERRTGVEFQAKTVSFHGLSLSAGAEFITTKDLNSGEILKDFPTQVYDIAVSYKDNRSWTALLQGRHLNWNATDPEQSKYHSFLVDMNAIKKLISTKGSSLEAFASVHNLLNTPQYLMYIYPNPGRWYEAGVRYKF